MKEGWREKKKRCKSCWRTTGTTAPLANYRSVTDPLKPMRKYHYRTKWQMVSGSAHTRSHTHTLGSQ